MADLTPPQRRALELMAGYEMLAPRTLARLMWPDSPAWHRRPHRHDGRSGARGGTMPMNAAKLLWRLRDKGLVTAGGPYHTSWSLTEKGRDAIRGEDS